LRSRRTRSFRDGFAALPPSVQEQARAAYRRFQKNPGHPSLRFKKVHLTEPVYSVRVSLDYRAVGVVTGETIIWYWIGNHDDYEKLLARR
jgi:hypothetical protein